MLAKNMMDFNVANSRIINAAVRRVIQKDFDDQKIKHRLANGMIRDVEVHRGRINISGRTLMYSIISDVTKRKRRIL